MNVFSMLSVSLLLAGAMAQCAPLESYQPCTGRSVDLPTVECNAYQALYNSTNGCNWKLCSDYPTDPCGCHDGQSGFVCSPSLLQRTRATGPTYQATTYSKDWLHIYTIDLYNNDLVGTIPESIGDLAELNHLYLNDNELSGTIPKSVGNIKYLSVLHAQNNKLTGTVPEELGQCLDLIQLMLQNNELDASFIPYAVHEIDALKAMY